MRRLWLVALAVAVAGSASGQYFGKNKVRYDTFDWKVFSTPHFRISFYEAGEPSLEKVSSFAESAYDELARKLNFQIPDPIPIIAYATHADFEQTNVIVEFIPEGVGAFAVPARNRMVLPLDLPDIQLQKLIQHELTHIFQYEILFQGRLGKALTARAPHWFMEGMASYLADDEDSLAVAVMRDASTSDRVPSVGDPLGGYFSYRFGHKVMQFIEEEWGIDGLRDFIYEFRGSLGGGVERPLKRAFDLTVEEFDARFRAWLRKHYQDVTLERGNPQEFGPSFRVKEELRSYEVSPAASPSGDLIAAFSTYKNDIDVVLLGVPNRTLFRNLTKGNTTNYEYLVAQMLTIGPDRGRDLAFSPDGDLVAVFARRGRGRVLLLLDARKGGIAKEYVLDGVDQAMQPAFSPDGATVAFHAYAGGQADIYLLDLGSGAIRNFTDDPAYDAAPVYTADGQHLVYTSQAGEHSKLYEISVADPTQRRQLTFGPGDDDGAAFSRDGKRLFFASDRDQGIFDVYALELEDLGLKRLTRVIGAAINPVPVPTRDGERVVYQAYTKGRWQLYLTDPAEGTPVGREEPPQEVVEREPYVPPVSVTVTEDKISEVKRHKLFAENIQVLVGFDEDQTIISQTYLSLSDHYGDRRFVVLLESVSDYSNFRFTYANLANRLQWGATVFDDRAYYTSQDPYNPGRRLKQLYRQTGGAFFVSYPISLYHRVEGSVGYVSQNVNYPVYSDEGPTYLSYKADIPFIQTGIVGDTTFWREYGPHAGRRWSFELSYAPDVKEGGTFSQDAKFEGRQYIPLSKRNELAFRLYAAASEGNQPAIFYFGGLDTLRGFYYRSLAGNRAAYLNAEWRFPLIDYLIFPWLQLSDLRGRVFVDVGAAYFDLPGAPDFKFMEEGRLKDGVSSYGFGFSLDLFGLPMHWDFAKIWDFKESLEEGYRTTFWIGFRY